MDQALAMSAGAIRLQQSQQRAQLRLRYWNRMSAASYALDALFLALYAFIEVIPWGVPFLYGAIAAVVCSAQALCIARGWNRSFRDPNMVVPGVCIGAALQLYVVAAAPQIAFPYLANLFTVFAFGMTWLSLRDAAMVWSAGAAATGAVLYWSGSRIGAATASPGALLLSALYFALVLGRLLAVSVQANGMRRRLAESRRRLAETLAQIEQLAHYDELTKAYNRRSLMTRLEQERSRAERTGTAFTVALFDLDHFKQVNDGYGHAAGDLVLKGFVEMVHATMRQTDVFGRFGGEEFLLILTATPPAFSMNTLSRIQQAIEARDWEAIASGVKITVSAGAAGHQAGESMAELLGRADAALYQAKNAGRNRAVVV